MDGKLAALLARRRAAQEDSEREERGLYGNDALDVQHGGVLASTAGEQVKQASQFSSPGRNNPSIQLHQRPSAAARDASAPQASQPEPAQPAIPPKKPAAGIPKLQANRAPADAPGLGAYAAMSSGSTPAKSSPPQAPSVGGAGAAGGSSVGAPPSKPPPPLKAPAPAQSPPAAPASPPAAPASGGGPTAPQSGVEDGGGPGDRVGIPAGELSVVSARRIHWQAGRCCPWWLVR
jgi:hypothetical protein